MRYTTRTRALYIVNPAAGGGRAARLAPRLGALLRGLGAQAEVVVARGPGDLEDLAERGAREGYSPVVAVGGDGTVQGVANGLLRAPRPPPLGVVPAGRGNDLARTLRLPGDVEGATRLILGGATRRIDLGRCGGRFYLSAGGAGFDARVGRVVGRTGSGGALAYALAVLAELRRYEPADLTLHLDGEALRRRSLLVAVANGRYYGGGMLIAPRARPDDGLLDVCIGGDLSRREVLALLPGIYYGRHVRHPKVEFRRARRVRIEGPPGTPVHLDGESASDLPAEFEVVPGALLVVGVEERSSAEAWPRRLAV